MRWLSVLASVFLLGAATAVLVAPIDAPAAPVRTAVVYGPALLAIALGILVWIRHGLYASRSVGLEPAEPGDGPTPRDGVGYRIDRVVRSGSDAGVGSRSLLEADVGRAVEVTLQRTEGLSETAARERIRDGTWTADPHAATLLGRTDHRPPGVRLRDWLAGRGYERCLRAVIDELERRRGRPEPETPPDTGRSRTRAESGYVPTVRPEASLERRGGPEAGSDDPSTDGEVPEARPNTVLREAIR